MPISDALLLHCENLLKAPIQATQTIGGGDINEACLLKTKQGSFFLKYNNHPSALAMLKAEWQGIEQLEAAQVIQTPRLIACGSEASTAFLMMHYIPSMPPNQKAWERFGQSLADLHRVSQKDFGLDHHNFIGRLPQSNHQHSSWTAFYQSERLEPQVKLAIDQQKMPASYIPHFEGLYLKLDEICPQESPALIHGDLWSGNFLINQKGEAVLIDPSVCYAHREMDLAMSMLFGGFSPIFYQAYQACFPTAKGLDQRLEIYQLYYLLVHVNLFGESYLNAVKRIIRRF